MSWTINPPVLVTILYYTILQRTGTLPGGDCKILKITWEVKPFARAQFHASESLNVTFEESPPPSKTSPLVDDDLVESQVIKNQNDLENDKEDELLNREIVNIKESKSHPLDSVIGKLNERTLKIKSSKWK